ncbi:MAG: HNH endonuclease [Phycisphaerales bacterium]
MSTYRIKITLPDWLDKILVWPVLVLRRLWYGYTFRRIPLANSNEYAIVDPGDYPELSKYTWWLHSRKNSHLVMRLSKHGVCYRPVFMHRQIMSSELTEELVVDHINHNGRDNRKANLRIATIAQNNMNKRSRGGVSKYKGVVYRAHKKLWVARITVNGRRMYIKSCKSEIDAAKAYDAAAKKYYGKFAYLNFPPAKKQKGLRNVLPRVFCVLCEVFNNLPRQDIYR